MKATFISQSVRFRAFGVAIIDPDKFFLHFFMFFFLQDLQTEANLFFFFKWKEDS